MLHDFQLAGRRVRLWQRTGESYGHVLMKWLGYVLFVGDYPNLEIEKRVGLRYKPDLVALGDDGNFVFWGEAGDNSLRKTLWLLKHAPVEKLVLFKIGASQTQLIKQLRDEIAPKYRADGKLILINFVADIVRLTAAEQIEKVSKDWFTETEI